MQNGGFGYTLQRMIISDIRHLPMKENSDRAAGIVSHEDILLTWRINFMLHELSELADSTDQMARAE